MRTILLFAILAGCDREQREVTRALEDHHRASDQDELVVRWAREDQARCDAAIPPALRERFLQGLDPSTAPRSVTDAVDCRFAPPGADPSSMIFRGRGVSVMIECSAMATDPERIKTVSEHYAVSEKPIDGVGRAAIASRFRVKFWATKADCNATIDWYLGADQLVPFARALDEALATASWSGSGAGSGE